MKLRVHGYVMAAAVAAGAVGLGVGGCEQPQITCRAGHGYPGYAARYILKSGTGACAEYPGDIIGMQSWNPPDESGKKPDATKASVAVQATNLGLYAYFGVAPQPDPDPNHKVYSQGDFQDVEPEDDFCSVPALTPAEQSFPEVPEDLGDPSTPDDDVPAFPATSFRYVWSNLKLYVTPAAAGTQFSADLEYTENGCTATYSVVGVYPAVDCTTYDADGNPVVDANGLPVPNEGACLPEPDSAAGRPYGSGINPDFPVRCDPTLAISTGYALCVLTSDKIPALEEGD